MTVTNNEIAREFAERLLAIEAVSLSPDAPFTWASGLHSPIYCDNRVTLSDPQTRDLIADGLASLVRTNFHQVDVVAGTATAGIAHAALAADRLGAPMAYVRSAPKDHGRGNHLISTGGSVLKAAQAVEREGSTVVGVLALFSYELEKGHRAFEKAGVPLYTLSNYPILIEVAAESGRITSEQQATLATWSSDPQAWSDAH